MSRVAPVAALCTVPPSCAAMEVAEGCQVTRQGVSLFGPITRIIVFGVYTGDTCLGNLPLLYFSRKPLKETCKASASRQSPDDLQMEPPQKCRRRLYGPSKGAFMEFRISLDKVTSNTRNFGGATFFFLRSLTLGSA